MKKNVLVYCFRYRSRKKEVYYIINDLCPNFKDLRNDDKFYCLLHSDDPNFKGGSKIL